MYSTINYLEHSELRKDSTTVNKNLFSPVWPLIPPCPLGTPFQGEVSIEVFWGSRNHNQVMWGW